MVQELARKTAKKMENQGVIASKTIPIYAYGLELLYSSLAGVVAFNCHSECERDDYVQRRWDTNLHSFLPMHDSASF